MPRLRRKELIDLLYLALAEPIGLLLWSEDPLKLQGWLASARLDAKDPALDILAFRQTQSFPEGNLVIVKKQPRPKSSPDEERRLAQEEILKELDL